MKRVVFLHTIICIFLCNLLYGKALIKSSIIENVSKHFVSIGTYHFFTEEQYKAWLTRARKPVQTIIYNNVGQYQIVIYIGSGAVLKNGFIITAGHMVAPEDSSISAYWIFNENWKEAIQADLMAHEFGAGDDFYKDYGVLKLRKETDLPGLIVSKKQILAGEKCMFIGSVGGMAFFKRFGHVTVFHKFFQRLEDGLHLSFWLDFPFICVYPGGPGDSGGIIVNERGEIAGIMYCGIELYAENYVFSNPIKYLWDFLKRNRLKLIAEK